MPLGKLLIQGGFELLPKMKRKKKGFGYWISGLVDGEGSFVLQWHKIHNRGRAFFIINLRSDDFQVLKKVRAFLKCGTLVVYRQQLHPMVRYVVSGYRDLMNKVIPFFLDYPLRAKKKRDFLIWKSAVELIYQISQRGRKMKWWRSADIESFQLLVEQLRETRKYVPLTKNEQKKLRSRQPLRKKASFW